MSNYTQFKVEAANDDTRFRVLVKNFFGYWVSGFVYTNYFSISYQSLEEAKTAVKGYKSRFTEIG